MKALIRSMLVVSALVASQALTAQAPAGAQPARLVFVTTAPIGPAQPRVGLAVVIKESRPGMQRRLLPQQLLPQRQLLQLRHQFRPLPLPHRQKLLR